MVVVSSEATIQCIKEHKVPKGDVFSFAKVAALFAIKKTSDLIPDCHPLPIEFSEISFHMDALTIQIIVEVHTIYKTGVEVEAMHGASVAALTIYDMLKPIDKGLEISHIKLLKKQGGKTDYSLKEVSSLTAAVIVCSDSVFQKRAEDKAGILVKETLSTFQIETKSYFIIPDEAEAIQDKVKTHTENAIDLLIFVGGTGVSPRDITPDVIKPLLDVELMGVMEQARSYGQERMPYAMLSRSVAGFIKNTLVVTFPGSVKGAKEYLDALFPQILHAFEIRAGKKHAGS